MAAIYPAGGGVPTEPTVFIDAATVHSLMNDGDISSLFLYELDQAPNLVHNCDRLHLIVVNSAPTTVLRTVLDVTHGVQYLQPGVPGADGTPSLPPNHATGNPDTDWMDAPPPGCAAVGMWVFEQASGMSVYGIEAGAVLELPDISTHLTFGGVVPWSMQDIPTSKVATYVVAPGDDGTPAPTSVDYSAAVPAVITACGNYLFQLRPYEYDHDQNGFDKFYLGLLFISLVS